MHLKLNYNIRISVTALPTDVSCTHLRPQIRIHVTQPLLPSLRF